MGARTLYQPKCFQPELVEICGKATGAAGVAYTALIGPGIKSIVDSGSGVSIITLEDKWDTLLFAGFGVIDAGTVDDWEVVVTAEDVAGAKTITLAIFKSGSITSLPTTAKLMVNLKLRNTSRAR